MKTIVISDNGNVTCSAELTDEERLAVGDFLFDERETDNQYQYVFYTGIISEFEASDEEDNG